MIGYLVWLLNLYNFMDGIDGLACIEAITVCLGGALVYVLAVPRGEGWMVPVLLLSAVTGFLVWNFPRARIFMGDAGSGFLGLSIGVLSIQNSWAAPELFWSWVILLGTFIVDATVTLIRRIMRGRIFGKHITITPTNMPRENMDRIVLWPWR
jgi:Fuc2NAc and GlcNAc transferase